MDSASIPSTPQLSPIIGFSSEAASPFNTPETENEFDSDLLADSLLEGEKYILVTGGLGYIGSHATLELLKAGHNVIIIDNLCNSFGNVLDRIKFLLDQHYSTKLDRKLAPNLDFHQIDYCNVTALRNVLEQYMIPTWQLDAVPGAPRRSKICGVVHFAAFKAVAESIQIPLSYYANNVAGFVGLLETLNDYNIKTMVFSSSATVYGTVDQGNEDVDTIAEEYCVHAEQLFDCKDRRVKQMQQGFRGLTSPYGRTKWVCEAILSDLCVSDPEWRVIVLRYFNPVGCDPSGLLGEDPLGTPNNLMPVVCRVLQEKASVLNVFGSDYDTTDGTGVRDYIHVSDLATGHVAAIAAAILGQLCTPFRTYNLGGGQGHSVLELVKTMMQVSGKEIPLQFTSRRRGDVATSVANPFKAESELNWKAKRSLLDSCRDTWNFVCKNPIGYRME